ncbi:MAG TPA: SDR family NAD(P)-dependent oxidoreductase, partial [Nitrososphaeraceae archaeon]|nr:SDR family NAD(P)-dependent oxidoreductase [Nitrososphaeraceae archaeon]
MKQNQDKVVFITGTSSGLGLLTSVQLAAANYQVVAAVLDMKESEQLKQLAAAKGIAARISIVELDIANEAQVEAVITDTIDRYGKIDVLINNAGIGGHGFIEEIPLGAWRRTFDVNVFGTLSCIRAVLPHMRTRKSGTIINMSSLAGRVATPGTGPYSATKFALEAISESLRLEMAPFGVKVVAIEPCSFKTHIWKKLEDTLYSEEGSPYTSAIEEIRKWSDLQAKNSADPIEV